MRKKQKIKKQNKEEPESSVMGRPTNATGVCGGLLPPRYAEHRNRGESYPSSHDNEKGDEIN